MESKTLEILLSPKYNTLSQVFKINTARFNQSPFTNFSACIRACWSSICYTCREKLWVWVFFLGWHENSTVCKTPGYKDGQWLVMVAYGNRTECRTIQGVIGREISNRRARTPRTIVSITNFKVRKSLKNSFVWKSQRYAQSVIQIGGKQQENSQLSERDWCANGVGVLLQVSTLKLFELDTSNSRYAKRWRPALHSG